MELFPFMRVKNTNNSPIDFDIHQSDLFTQSELAEIKKTTEHVLINQSLNGDDLGFSLSDKHYEFIQYVFEFNSHGHSSDSAIVLCLKSSSLDFRLRLRSLLSLSAMQNMLDSMFEFHSNYPKLSCGIETFISEYPIPDKLITLQAIDHLKSKNIFLHICFRWVIQLKLDIVFVF